jgi:hypothetical protein
VWLCSPPVCGETWKRVFAARPMNGNLRNRPELPEWHESRTKVTIAVVPKKRQRVDVNETNL